MGVAPTSSGPIGLPVTSRHGVVSRSRKSRNARRTPTGNSWASNGARRETDVPPGSPRPDRSAPECSRADLAFAQATSVPVKLPPPPAVELVSVSQSRFAEPPTKEPPPRVLTNADLREAGEKSAGRNIAHDLRDLAFQLRRFQSVDKLVERLSADEREEVRLGIEAVMRIKAALDRLGQPTS